VLLTVIAFAALTGVFVALHLRRAPGARAAEIRCPRCRKAVPQGASHCPSCRAPLQAFELATARVVSGAPAASGPRHAVVRADVCVGCGACVDVCPEPGAIRLENKLAIVNLDLCKGHGNCAEACPVSGIVITAGESVQRLQVPQVSPDFESNVPGMYVVGELGGRGLIKNAVNEGKLAIEHVARTLAASRAPAGPGVYDVVIVGAGPAGLSAGLEALSSRLNYLILEQGTLADTIAKYPREKVLFAEPLRVPLYGDLWVADASKESLLKVWQTAIEKTGLRVTTGQRVENVVREASGFIVRTAQGEHRGRRVVLAMGRRGTPRRLGVTGEDLDKVFYEIVEMEAFAGKRMLVVGGGDSAIESALGLSIQPGASVTLSYRGGEFSRAKERNQKRIADAVAAKRVALLLESEVREIRRDLVVLEHQGALRLLPNDAVVIRIGGEAPYPFLERLGVRIVYKEIPFATGAAKAG